MLCSESCSNGVNTLFMINVRRLKLLSYVPVKHKVQLADGSRQIEEEETAFLALLELFLI